MIRLLVVMMILINTTIFSAPQIEVTEKTRVPIKVEFQGRAKSADMIKIYSDIEGNIKDVCVENGDIVEKNQVILRVENKRIDIELEEAKGNYEISKVIYEKYNTLYLEGLVSTKEMYIYKGEYIQKKGIYDLAIKNYEDLEIKAVSKGVIGNIELVVGDEVVVGEALGTLASNEVVEIVGYVDSARINKIERGDKAKINFIEDMSYTGSVSEINPFIDKEVKKFKVGVEFKKNSKVILDDLYGSVEIEVRDELKIMIPKDAILYYNLKTYVYKIVDGRYKKTLVELGKEFEGDFEVIRGISVGEEIVVSDLYNVLDGEAVR